MYGILNCYIVNKQLNCLCILLGESWDAIVTTELPGLTKSFPFDDTIVIIVLLPSLFKTINILRAGGGVNLLCTASKEPDVLWPVSAAMIGVSLDDTDSIDGVLVVPVTDSPEMISSDLELSLDDDTASGLLDSVVTTC